MTILGIESSCDDTSVALVQSTDTGLFVLAEKTASQIDIHKKYGGVVPEIAGRKHAEKILPVVEAVMEGQDKPDAIAVTAGPGLMTGLLVGVEVAKTLSYLWNVPIIRTNHIEGHVYSVLLTEQPPLDPPLIKGGEGAKRPGGVELRFPILCLIVSGGHTELTLMKNHGEYELVGKTRDDAAGEAFDKVAKLLDLEYPGGPKISKLAENGDVAAIDFPRPMINDDSFDFSFSGLKTAALYHLRDNPDAKKEDVCASFEQAIVDVLVAKTKRAAEQYKPKTVILAGGVSANKKLRTALAEAIDPIPCSLSPISYAMDNAAMIAAAGIFHAKKKDYTSWQELEADPNWKIYQTEA